MIHQREQPALASLPESLARVEGALTNQVAAHTTACQQHLAAGAALKLRREKLADELLRTAETAKDVERIRLEVFNATIVQHRAAIALWRERSDLCRQADSALAAQESRLEDQLETARAKVSKALAKAGLTAEVDPQYPNNPGAARHRFQTQVDQAPEVRELLGRLDEIRASHRSALKDSGDAAREAAAAEAALQKLFTAFVW